jgi:hypothetical protein
VLTFDVCISFSQSKLGQIFFGHRPNLNANQFHPKPLSRWERFQRILSAHIDTEAAKRHKEKLTSDIKDVAGKATYGGGMLMEKRI